MTASVRHALQRPRRVRWLLARVLMLAALGGLVALAIALVVLALGRPPTDAERRLLELSAVATAACALAWVPLRHRAAGAASRIIGADRLQPDSALRAIGARLASALPLDELLLQFAETLRRALALDAAELWTGPDGVLERVASDPERDAAMLILSPGEQAVVASAGVCGTGWISVWLPGLMAGRQATDLRVAPISSTGQLLGLLVGERGARAPFTHEDERLFADAARQAALTLRNVHLDVALRASLDELRLQAEELRASRARVVSAADAERRRIERDLHDGAQQDLVGLVVNVRLARQLVGSDPAEAERVLDAVGHDARDAVDQLRELAHGIYPPLLLDRGLAEALHAAARRAPGARVVRARLRRYPPEIEATVYFCCLEALQNAAKHAGAGARTTVRVWEELGGLRFEVSDDGAGFDEGRANGGAGLANMRDRLGALGGRLELASEPGRGTSITGTIPVVP